MILGTGVLLLPLHHPVEIAEQLATLDVIADGRLIFGVGLGYRDVENQALGQDPKDRVGRLVEGLEAVQRLWSGEPVDYEGRHFKLRSARISMRPMQSPRPPIWLAANSDSGVRRAARLGDAWLMNPHATLSTLERQLELFRATRRELGRPPAVETPLIKECYVAPDAAIAFAEAASLIGPKYRAYRTWEQDKALPPGETFDATFAELARDRFIIGDPARVVEEIARCRERLGVTVARVLLLAAGLLLVLALVGKVSALRLKRDGEAVAVRGMVVDALGHDPELLAWPLTATVRVPLWIGSPVTIRVIGEVPSKELKRAALLRVKHTAAAELSVRVRIKSRIGVAPRAAARPELRTARSG